MRIALSIMLLASAACQSAGNPVLDDADQSVDDISAELQAAGSGGGEAASARRPSGPRWRAVQLVERFDGGDATEPQVGTDPQGRAFAAWTQTAGTLNSVWASRSMGPNWGAAAQLDDMNTLGSRAPQLTVSDNGNAVVLWQRAQRKVYGANQFRNGSWRAPTILFDSDPVSAFFGPVLSGSRTGTALVAWASTAGRGSNLLTSTLAGTTWTGAQLPLAPAMSLPTMGNVRTASAPNGDSTVLWSQSEMGMTFNLFINQFRSGAWGTPQPVDLSVADSFGEAGLAIVRGPAELVVWKSASGVWANKHDSSWSGAVRIRSLPAGAVVSNVQVVSDSRGNNAFAIWLENNRVWASRFNGTSWAPAVNIEAVTTGNAAAPRIALEPSGIAVAVWSHAATRSDIWANRFVPASGWGTAVRIENDDAGDATAPSVAVDPRGDAIAVWQQSDGTRFNVVSSRFQ